MRRYGMSMQYTFSIAFVCTLYSLFEAVVFELRALSRLLRHHVSLPRRKLRPARVALRNSIEKLLGTELLTQLQRCLLLNKSNYMYM